MTPLCPMTNLELPAAEAVKIWPMVLSTSNPVKLDLAEIEAVGAVPG